MADPTNFDDLLDLTPDDESIFGDLLGEPEGTVEDVVADVVADPEEAYIRELEAELAKPLPEPEEDIPVAVAPVAKTASQLRIEELEDQLAQRRAAELERAPVEYSKPTGKGRKILIHIVEDGLTALGTTWYRGQEIEFEVPGPDYERTKDINGVSWVDTAGDVAEQYRRWGKQYLAPGPFIPRPGERFEDEVAAEDARRGRSVPVIRN